MARNESYHTRPPLSKHAEERARERGCPPYVLRMVKRFIARMRGDGYVITKGGWAFPVENNVASTTLAPGMDRRDDLPVIRTKKF